MPSNKQTKQQNNYTFVQIKNKNTVKVHIHQPILILSLVVLHHFHHYQTLLFFNWDFRSIIGLLMYRYQILISNNFSITKPVHITVNNQPLTTNTPVSSTLPEYVTSFNEHREKSTDQKMETWRPHNTTIKFRATMLKFLSRDSCSAKVLWDGKRKSNSPSA